MEQSKGQKGLGGVIKKIRKVKINWSLDPVKKKEYWVVVVLSFFVTDMMLSVITFVVSAMFNNFVIMPAWMRMIIGIPLIFLLQYRIHEFLYPKLVNPLFPSLYKPNKK